MIAAPFYSRNVFEVRRLQQIVKWTVAAVRKHKLDAIAGCGHSGLVLASAAAYAAKRPCIAVRKAGEEQHSHDSNRVHAMIDEDAFRYAFVDDCVSSGKTLRHVVNEILRVSPNARLGAILTYSSAVSEFDVVNALGAEYRDVPRLVFTQEA